MQDNNQIINDYMAKLYEYKGCAFGKFVRRANVYDFIKEGQITFELEFVSPEGQEGLSGKFINGFPEAPIYIYTDKDDAYTFIEYEIQKQVNYLRDVLSKQPKGVVCYLTLKYDDDIVYKKQFRKE